jgi:hypothetical protein
METTISKETITAYTEAIFILDSVPPTEFKVDKVSLELISLIHLRGAETAALITAYNPFGEHLSYEENLAHQHELIKIIDDMHLDFMTGRGVDTEKQWEPEESILIFDLSLAEAIEIGNRVRQNAIVWIGVDGIPRLELLV